MTARRLVRKRVAKPWGRRDLPPPFGPARGGEPAIGEIWFEDEGRAPPPLLVKYLFTSEALSIQVHPGDAEARAAGHPHGKDEAWAVLEAAPGAVIGLGLRRRTTPAALAKAAADGSIAGLVDWKPVVAGDILFSPAGTVHAIGAGLVVVEVQQNVDLTYRLYDHGRARDLHVDAGVAAAKPGPARGRAAERELRPGRTVLGGESFVLERWQRSGAAALAAREDRPVWLIPLAAGARLDGAPLLPGEVWLADGPALLDMDPRAMLLAAYCGRAADPALLADVPRVAFG